MKYNAFGSHFSYALQIHSRNVNDLITNESLQSYALTHTHTGKRQRSSTSFYGKCVDEWITVTDPIPKHFSLQDPDLLVFVTYPMLKHNFVLDKDAIGLLEDIHTSKAR